MHITVTRTNNNEDRCLGTMFLNDKYFCLTLEDTVRAPGVKVQDRTAIPAGTYKVIVNMSPKKRKLYPRLLEVPMFAGILIHSGNTEDHSSGCILVGASLSADKQSIHGGSIVSPMLTKRLLTCQELGEAIDITITDAFGTVPS